MEEMFEMGEGWEGVSLKDGMVIMNECMVILEMRV